MKTNFQPANQNPNHSPKHAFEIAIKWELKQLADFPERQAALLELVQAAQRHTQLLRPILAHKLESSGAAYFTLWRLRNFARRHAFWIRPIESWSPTQSSPRLILRELAAHLFARYPTPHFLDSAWDNYASPHESFRYQSWYMKLARGSSLRALNLPLTQRMLHLLREAPDHFTIPQAIRYAEVRGLGSDERLARHIATTRLGVETAHAEFWRTVLNFFVVHQSLSPQQITAAIDFIHSIKFAGEEIQTPNGLQRRTPPWPDFRIEGRTAKALFRLVHRWRVETAEDSKPAFTWQPSGIPPFEYFEPRPGQDPLHWTIVELTNSTALVAEGRALSHCVGTYLNKCRRRFCSIWSLRLRVGPDEKRMATMEITPNSEIIQTRANCNRWPGAHSERIIELWAKAVGLFYDRNETIRQHRLQHGRA